MARASRSQPRVHSPKRATDSRSRMIAAARDLFWNVGYLKTSLGDVARQARVNLGSIYYFFPAKEDLLLAVLDWYKEALEPVLIRSAFSATADPIVRILLLLEGYRERLIASGFSKGCPIGNLVLELGDDVGRARPKINENFDQWRGWVEKCLADAGNDLPSDLDRSALASFILTVMEGAVMQARSYKSLAPFDAAIDMLKEFLSRLQQKA